MKKLHLLVLGLIFYGAILNAQSALYLRVKALVQETHPELITDQKLLAVNVWQLGDDDSREANKGFEKVYNVYQVAKLKGGSRGIVVVGVSIDNLSADAVITLNKDGVVKTIAFKLDDVKEAGKLKNIVFDSNGNEVYRNLQPSVVFSSIHNLITR